MGPLLKERVRMDSAMAEVTLTEDGAIRWREAGGRDRCLLVESEVLGFDVEEGRRIRIKAFAVDREGGGLNCFGGSDGEKRRRVRRDYVLEMPTEESVEVWAERLQQTIDSLGRPKRLFILLNPFGGTKCARKIFQDEAKPLLEAAGVSYTLQETEYQLHAQQVAAEMDLLKYDGIICVSGDGILVEVLNGLLKREDWKSAIKMPLGLIPAGSGNAMVKSLLESVGDTNSVSNAVLAIIRGHTRALDIATISQGKTLFFSALMMCWGLIADSDIESEKYRWMGSSRFEIYPLVRVLNLRKYDGQVAFVPAPGYEIYGTPLKLSSLSGSLDSVYDDNDKAEQHGYQGPKTCFKSSEWRSIEGPFVSVMLLNVPWLNGDAVAAPEAKFSDGYYDLVIVKDCPKTALISLLLGMSDGSHVKSPYVEYIKVKAFRLAPGQRVGNPAKGGIVDSDGEVLARGSRTYLCDSHSDPMAYGPLIELKVEQG